MQEWQQQELPCHSAPDPDIFFPDPATVESLIEAEQFCEGCPAQADCFAFGRDNMMPGIWGGVMFGINGDLLKRAPTAYARRMYEKQRRRKEGMPR